MRNSWTNEPKRENDYLLDECRQAGSQVTTCEEDRRNAWIDYDLFSGRTKYRVDRVYRVD